MDIKQAKNWQPDVKLVKEEHSQHKGATSQELA